MISPYVSYVKLGSSNVQDKTLAKVMPIMFVNRFNFYFLSCLFRHEFYECKGHAKGLKGLVIFVHFQYYFCSTPVLSQAV